MEDSSSQIAQACNSMNHTVIGQSKSHILTNPGLNEKITLGKNSRLLLFGNESIIFLRGEGLVECCCQDTTLFVHKPDKLKITVTTKVYKVDIRYHYLPTFESVLQSPKIETPTTHSSQGVRASQVKKDQPVAVPQKNNPRNAQSAQSQSRVAPAVPTPQPDSRKPPIQLMKLEVKEVKVTDGWNSMMLCSAGILDLPRCRFETNFSEPGTYSAVSCESSTSSCTSPTRGTGTAKCTQTNPGC